VGHSSLFMYINVDRFEYDVGAGSWEFAAGQSDGSLVPVGDASVGVAVGGCLVQWPSLGLLFSAGHL
jgi:hypothetical protein